MAVKSQIAIEVDSAEFIALKTAFDKYETALKKMPATWQNVGQASSAIKTNFESIVDGMKVVGSSLAAITTSGKEFFQVTTATARHWHDLALSTASVAKNIVGATKSLLKWTGIISLVTGGAGLFGFDRLAHSISSQRQAAMGTGGERGARIAFLTNFRRFGDPESILSRVSEAQTNIKESNLLLRLGLTREDLKGDPADVATKALRASARIASHDKVIGRQVGSDPLLQIWTPAERIRLRDHPEEVNEVAAEMRKDQKSGRFNLSPSDQKAYQDFTTKMETASKEIETTFVKGLVKLPGPLTELSDAVVKLVAKFTEKALPGFIDDLAKAVDWLAKEVDKPSFVEKVEGVVAMIGSLASSFGGMLSSLAGFARWLGVALPSTEMAQLGSGGGGETSLADQKYQGGKGAGGRRGFSARAGGSTWAGATPANTASAIAAAKDQLRKEGVPEEHLDAAAAALVGNAIAESGLNPNTVHDQGTGYGIYGARDDPRRGGKQRRSQELSWLSAHGFAKNSLEGQVRQMAHSAITDPDYSATRNALINATDATTAGDVVERNFEAPRVFNNRHAAVRKAQEAGRSNINIHAVPGGNTSLGSAAAAAGSP